MKSSRNCRSGSGSGDTTTAALTVAIVMALSAVGVGCEFGVPAGREPYYEFNYTDMQDQPKVKPQRGAFVGDRPWAMYKPPLGAVAMDEMPYPYAQNEAAEAAKRGPNPLPATDEVLAKGKWIFDNYCIVCHGPKAAGDGKVTALFPKPPSLMRQKVRDYTDARIFHVPMRGQASMPSYAKQIEDEEIWAVVHYIRKLQSELPVAPPTKKDLEQLQNGAQKGAQR